jgi:hypothetical protein
VRSCYPAPNPQGGGPPLVGCPRLLIQYIRSYPPYLEAVSSVRNVRTRHAVVTTDPPEYPSSFSQKLGSDRRSLPLHWSRQKYLNLVTSYDILFKDAYSTELVT